MLLQPFLAALILGRAWSWTALAALSALLLLFILREPLIILVRQRLLWKTERAESASAVKALAWELPLLLACGALLLFKLPWLPLVLLAAGALLFTSYAVWMSARNRQRSLVLQILSAAALNASAFLGSLAALGRIEPWAWWLWLLLFLHSLTGVLVVRARLNALASMKNPAGAPATAAYRAAAAAQILTAAFGLGLLLRGLWFYALPLFVSAGVHLLNLQELRRPAELRRPLKQVGQRALAVSVLYTLLCISVLLVAAIPLSAAAQQWNNLRALPAVSLQSETYHVQGIDADDMRLWVSSVDTRGKRGLLFLFDRETGKLRHSAEVHSGDRYHPGGISLSGASIWVPVAEYRRSSTTSMQKRDRKTFVLQDEFAVDDHIGAVAVVPEGLVGANWDAREFYVWTAAGKLLRKMLNPTGVAIQDMKYVSGALIAGGLEFGGTGAVVWLEWPSLKTLRIVRTSRTDRGVAFTQEGLAVYGGVLYLLPEDGPSQLFSFELPPTWR